MLSNDIYMLIGIPPKYSVSEIVGYLKGMQTENISMGIEHFGVENIRLTQQEKIQKKIHEYIDNPLKEEVMVD